LIFNQKKNNNLYVAYIDNGGVYATGKTLNDVMNNVGETKEGLVENLRKAGKTEEADALNLKIFRFNVNGRNDGQNKGANNTIF